MTSPGNQHRAYCIGTLSFPMVYAEMNLLAEIWRVASGDDCKVRRSRQ